MVKHVVSEPTGESAALFKPGNPAELFTEMHLIGHGNFGSVYQARRVEAPSSFIMAGRPPALMAAPSP